MTNKCCLLHGCDEADAKGVNCKSCGWHLAEHQRRLWLIQRDGLKPGKDGKRRLVLHRQQKEAK